MESGTTCETYLETKRPIGESFQLSKATSKAYCGTGVARAPKSFEF
jgi:hypothetical protein